MITEITLNNFKCFNPQIVLPVGQVNLLTGINGRGKSTMLQALLLMRQSPEYSRTTHHIIFNGSCVDLGTFDDVRNSDISRTEPVEVKFVFSSNNSFISVQYTLVEDITDDMIAQIKLAKFEIDLDNEKYHIQAYPEDSKRIMTVNGAEYPLQWKNLIPEGLGEYQKVFNRVESIVDFTKIHYISADRIGPREFYDKQSFGDFPNVGKRGEYTANILSKKGENVVDEKLCLLSSATSTVLDQTEAWISKIFDGGKIRIRTTEANIVILSINSIESSKTFKPTNVGFGYSYVLPIIVSALIAQPGEILIIENPEAHLHPYAQSQLIKFLAKVSTIGIQIFIESHSDHILNGLRIAVLDNIIQNDEVNVLYFFRDTVNSFVQIPINDNGSIDNWPNGFFDQTNLDFSKLFGV
jgi:predicted ATPase